MSKKKNTMALYEVISNAPQRRRQDLAVPTWMAEGEEPPAGEGQAPPPMPEAETAPAPRQKPTPPPTQRTAFPLSSGEPVIGRSGDRWNFSLSLRASAIVLGGLVAVLVIVFLLGRWSKGGESLSAAVLMNPRPAPPTTRVAGKSYLVIVSLGEGFGPSGALTERGQALVKKANEIVGFCRARGYHATINKWKSKYVIVWSLDGFDDPNSEEAKAFAAEIAKLGQENVAQGGKFDLSQDEPRFLKQ